MKKKYLLISLISLGYYNAAIAQDIHPSLKKTASKINTTGEHVSMTKLDGDIGAITQYIDVIIKAAKKDGISLSEKFNAKQLLSILGLNSLKATGSSAKELDNAWINHSYLENGGNNKGIFSLIGKNNQDYIAPNISPAGTDLALQLQLDLRQLAPMITQIAAINGKDKMLSSEMDKTIPELGITPNQLLAKLNVTISLALDLNTDKNARTNPLTIIAGGNAIARIDGLNWLWNKLEDQIIAQSQIPLEKTEAHGITTYSVPAEMKEQLMGYSPQLIIDNTKNQIWISTNPHFLAKCQSGENSLADSAKFKAAMEHLPTKANSMMYLSKGLLQTAQAQYENAAENNMFGPDFAKAKEIADRLMEDITESDKGWAMALNKDNDGILLASRGPAGLQHLNYLTSMAPFFGYIGFVKEIKVREDNLKLTLPAE